MNWVQYLLIYLIAPLIVGGLGAAAGAYVGLKVLKQDVRRLQGDFAQLRKDFEDHREVAIVEKDCKVCQEKIDNYHAEALNAAKFVKEEAVNTAKTLERVTELQIDRVMDSLTNLSSKIDSNHKFLSDVAEKQITMAEDLAAVKAVIGRKGGK